MRLLVTGGCGFIGSHFIRLILKEHPSWTVINLDKLTYAGNPANLAEVQENSRYQFIKGDIADPVVVMEAMEGVEAVVNFAAETHVDRSIGDPESFLRTDVFGTYVLLEEARRRKIARYIQISTDEVYGSIAEGYADEEAPLRPSSPYSSSKAGGDLLVQSYFTTYRMPVLITRCTNNYGPNQYPEKLIPLFITNALEGLELPVYGDGRQRRDWIHVEDHCRAVELVLLKGKEGEIYNIAGGCETENLWITEKILEYTKAPSSLIKHVADRPGHDRRYAISCEKIERLGWRPMKSMEEGLAATVTWYQENETWWRSIKSGEYRVYYQSQYGSRLGADRS